MMIGADVRASGGTGERVAREPLTGRAAPGSAVTRAKRTGRRARDPDPATRSGAPAPGTGPARRISGPREDWDRGAGDSTRFVARKEHHDSGDLGRGRPARWIGLGHRGSVLGVVDDPR